MGWTPRHSDERMAHEKQRQSLVGRSRRFMRHLRYHPWHALRPIVVPLAVIGIIAVVAMTI